MTLNSGNFDSEIKIDFFESKTSGDHKLIGSAYTTLTDLQKGQRSMKFKSNSVEVYQFELKRTVNFLEYVFGGCNINLSIAIDYTLSNGDPKDPRYKNSSLHC
jgi:hypothetical protein